VAEVGRHDELLEKEGIYARLVARQLEKPGEKKNQ
jgi:ABC-type multidrug transport system fused ATPase/permease subunit